MFLPISDSVASSKKRMDGELRESRLEIRKDVDYVRRMKRARRIVALVMGISLAVFVIIAALAILNEGTAQFLRLVYSVNLYYYGAAFGVLFAGYMLRFPKWEMYIRALGVRIKRLDNLMIYLSMYSMDITPGRWGRGIVSYTINRLTGSRFATTFPAVVADIFTDFLGFGILAIVSAFFVQKYVLISIFITLLLLLPFVFLYFRRPFEFIKRRLSRFRSLRSFWEVGDLYFKEKNKLGKREYIVSIAYTLPSVVLNAVALYFVILAFGIHIGLAQMPLVMFIYSSSLLFGIVTGAPATLGITDAVLVGYLTFFFPELGITFGIAATITIFFRIVSVWFVQGFGSVALFYTMRHWNLSKS
ncbi:MAG TPA: lysylphosphatidylglycerol synthase transmembrane domain-containing protein [Candidatus Saccharimonadales bacterium]|nr:lysylphosphatidylglycerol synthase transmembrane domain-containing protein [Candidatus Saccharimonadales bacterium]